eukprot:UN03483
MSVWLFCFLMFLLCQQMILCDYHLSRFLILCTL